MKSEGREGDRNHGAQVCSNSTRHSSVEDPVNQMYKEEFEAKFPGQTPPGQPPSPSVENPGRVFPLSDPSKSAKPSPRRTTPDQFVGNPFLLNAALDKLDHAFGEVVALLEQEDRSQDRGDQGNPLLHRFKSWRIELERIRRGEEEFPPADSIPFAQPQPEAGQEGGMFAD